MDLPETVSLTPASFSPDGGVAMAAAAPYESGPGSYAEIAYAAPAHASTDVTRLIDKYAVVYEVPASLVRRVVKRESNFRPTARNGPYWGLMQIRHDTARGMGYDGPANGLLDAETNLKYAVKYLRGAYITADGDHDQAVRFYARGYYYDAKRKGLLEEAGLKTPRRKRLPETVVARAEADEQAAQGAAASASPVAEPAVAIAAEPATTIAAEPEVTPTFAASTPVDRVAKAGRFGGDPQR